MKIAEMEQHASEYDDACKLIGKAIKEKQYNEAMEHSARAVTHIDGMVKFRKKKANEPAWPSLQPVEVICKYAPMLFEHSKLRHLLEELQANSSVAKEQPHYLHMAQRAHAFERTLCRMWNTVESRPGIVQRELEDNFVANDVEKRDLRDAIDFWESCGIIRRLPQGQSLSVMFVSSLDEVLHAICSYCLARVKTKRERLYRPITCPRCKREDYFILSVHE